MDGKTLTVHIENSYTCGRESESDVEVRYPASGEVMEEWWDNVVQPHTGDGHPCGSSEHAYYSAEIVEASEQPILIGDEWSWEG